jgi:hypothetical protein
MYRQCNPQYFAESLLNILPEPHLSNDYSQVALRLQDWDTTRLSAKAPAALSWPVARACPGHCAATGRFKGQAATCTGRLLGLAAAGLGGLGQCAA